MHLSESVIDLKGHAPIGTYQGLAFQDLEWCPVTNNGACHAKRRCGELAVSSPHGNDHPGDGPRVLSVRDFDCRHPTELPEDQAQKKGVSTDSLGKGGLERLSDAKICGRFSPELAFFYRGVRSRKRSFPPLPPCRYYPSLSANNRSRGTGPKGP